MASLYSILIVTIVAASVNHCCAFTDAQREMLKEKLKANLAQCGPKFGVTLEQVTQWRVARKIPDNVDKCFPACMMKKSGLIDDKGLFSETVALEKVKQYASEDELAEESSSAVKICAKVNEASVSDGDAGCERTALLTKCIHEQEVFQLVELIAFAA